MKNDGKFIGAHVTDDTLLGYYIIYTAILVCCLDSTSFLRVTYIGLHPDAQLGSNAINLQCILDLQ